MYTILLVYSVRIDYFLTHFLIILVLIFLSISYYFLTYLFTTTFSFLNRPLCCDPHYIEVKNTQQGRS